MESVKIWLLRNGLGEYATKFEDDGWDDITLLTDIEDDDLKRIIGKRGHIVKFKKALEKLKSRDSENTKTELGHMYGQISVRKNECLEGQPPENSKLIKKDTNRSTPKFQRVKLLASTEDKSFQIDSATCSSGFNGRMDFTNAEQDTYGKSGNNEISLLSDSGESSSDEEPGLEGARVSNTDITNGMAK